MSSSFITQNKSQECSTLESYAKKNGAATTKVLKGGAYIYTYV